MKCSIVLVALLLVLLISCAPKSPGQIEATETTSSETPSPTSASTPTPSTESTPFSEVWATNQVTFYLNDLAKSPEAIRYLANLSSQGGFEGTYYESEIDQDYGGHKYSGWQVYYRPTGSPSKQYWGNLNWATFKDGYVTEGSNDAMRVKADLLELNENESVSNSLNDSQYETVTFTVEADGDYMFPIYLNNKQTLHLTWFVKEGERVWFHILTPSGKSLGFYEDGQFANGTLHEDVCQGFTEGKTIFSPSDYKWGEGYYEMYITADSGFASEVEVNYWIEDGEPSSSLTPTTTSTPTAT